jgi:hypothetical protein
MGGSISYQRINGETHFTIRLPIAGEGLRALEGGRTDEFNASGSEDPPLAAGTG